MKNKERFLTSEEERGKAREWAESSSMNEELDGGKYDYIAHRTEDEGSHFSTITDLHKASFIKEVIPDLLSKKQPGENLKVLDIGGGAGLYAKQIRESFPDEVKVYTTGLSKSTARRMNPDQHQDDLRWRSVLQLSPFEEFDLIIDTFGEATYGTDKFSEFEDGAPPGMKKYLEAVIKKLNPGGLASIVINIDWEPESLATKLEKEFPDISIEYSARGARLRITKEEREDAS